MVFIAGLINDVVIGLPIGISSLCFVLLCVAASYLRSITLSPNIIKDWIFFFITVLVVNSFSYTLLTLIFSFRLDYYQLLTNSIFTFLFYFPFSHLFGLCDKLIFGSQDDQ